jgi:hypothetical protein
LRNTVSAVRWCDELDAVLLEKILHAAERNHGADILDRLRGKLARVLWIVARLILFGNAPLINQ